MINLDEQKTINIRQIFLLHEYEREKVIKVVFVFFLLLRNVLSASNSLNQHMAV